MIDVVAVVSNSTDRLNSITNATVTNNAGAGGSSFFIQGQGGLAPGWHPDPEDAYNNRSDAIDSSLTVGVDGGAPNNGDYYANRETHPGANWPVTWGLAMTTLQALVGWYTPDYQFAESLSNFSGTRIDNGSAASGSYGIWCGHFVMNGATTSALWSATAVIEDGETGATASGSSVQFQMIPAPGAIALFGVAGLAAGRRRRA